MDNISRTDTTSQPADDAQPDQSPSQPLENAKQDQSGPSAIASEKKKEKKLGSKRGVETLFRVNYNNHIQLSELADGKANMLISINGLIISILIALIGPRMNDVAWFMLPVSILLVGCLMSLAFAIFASRPRLNKTPVTLEQVRNNKGNILFFGVFTKLPLIEFEQGMHELLHNPQTLYDNMIRDIYSMGGVLRKKYYYLQFAYTVFLMTVVIAVVAFFIIFLSSGIK